MTVIQLPTLRRRPVPASEPRPALSVVPEAPPRVPSTQEMLPLPAVPATPHPAVHRARCAPPVEAWARQFLQAALEVAAGRRPPSQLIRWTTEEVHATLVRRAALTGRGERTSVAVSVTVVRSVRLHRISDDVVEASAVVTDRGRVRAVATRLVTQEGRWRATALEIG